jgi:RNA-dependent RNA polymerase
MGQFDHIKVVAKYAARLGQCFSTTREIRGIHVPDRKKISDVERNGLCFTDGVGKISKFLAQLIIGEMGLDVFDDPTAFQFRMGGCKGVLAVWPDARGQEVHIRDSQEKFEAEYNGLEIIRCASFATATLNRQTITILESLGVHSSTFMELLDLQLERFEKSMTDKNEAIDMLTQFVDENQTTLVMAELLKADFKTIGRNEPFVTSILNLWRAWSLKLIKEKARIPIEQSAFVLGCVDETASLRGHDSSTEGLKRKDVSRLPQIFLQLSDPKSHKKTHIIEGTCIVGRNPSLHPGDIRVVQAVNEPKLHHLKDVVVFPMTGDKPVPSMLSGGDLDGDDFFIIWDKKLLPKEWNYHPMDYTAPKPRELDIDVNVDHVRDFFVSYMKNDVLGVVAYAHLGHADKFSPKHDICK